MQKAKTESALYIVIMDDTYDEEATATHLEEMIETARYEYYDTVYASYQEESEFVIDEKIAKKLKVDTLFTLKS